MVIVDQRIVKQTLETALDHPVTNEVARKVTAALQEMLDAVENVLETEPMTIQEYKDLLAARSNAAREEQLGLYE